MEIRLLPHLYPKNIEQGKFIASQKMPPTLGTNEYGSRWTLMPEVP